MNKTTISGPFLPGVFRLKPMALAVRLAVAGLLTGTSVPLAAAELPQAADNWVGSGAAAVDASSNAALMRINQQSDKVVLNWKEFNIGAGKQVDFVQPSSTAAALNKIHDVNPSQINGRLTANGQVYLINKNGFIFGQKAVIDVNSFLASTHDIADEVFEKGFISEFNDTGGAAFTLDQTNTDQLKQILIEQGAQIKADESGNIILLAPEIENHGTLEAGDFGQIMLVASRDKVYLQQAESDDFTGVLVEVDTGGKVSNFGDIVADQGTITMAGFMVNQAGRVNATTSVSVNGAIRLQAREGHRQVGNTLDGVRTTRSSDLGDGLGQQAQIVFAENSETSILPDPDSATSADGLPQATSYLEVSAHNVTLKAGSEVKATSGRVAITATNNYTNPRLGQAGTIIAENGSVIDVAGEKNVEIAMERNVGVIDARSSYVLRDSPNQKDGILFGEDALLVDLRQDTEIVDVEGAQNRIERSVYERMTTGGTVELTASGDVNIENGALIDISGGSVDFQSGNIQTTQLINQTGQQFDISDADPDDTFVELFDQEYFVPGYQEGKDAGGLTIRTAELNWQGSVDASATNGRLQRSEGERAVGGTIALNLSSDFNSTQAFRFENNNALTQMALSGAQNFTLRTLGSVTIDESLNLEPFARFSVEAGSVLQRGQIYAAGGEVVLAGKLNKSLNAAGLVTLESGSVIDVSGRWVNDQLTVDNAETPREAVAIDGGDISIVAGQDVVVGQGAVLKADGGAYLADDTTVSAGQGGYIGLLAASEYDFSDQSTATIANSTGLLYWNGTLSAAGLYQNGRLSLASRAFTLGNATGTDATNGVTFLAASDALFANFASIALLATNGDLKLTSAAQIDLTQQNRLLEPNYFDQPSQASIDGLTQPVVLADYFRSSSDLSLGAEFDLVMETGSSISAENGSGITLTADENIYIDGRISAPAGAITVQLNAGPNLVFDPTRALWLAEHAQLNTAGAVEFNPDGTVFGGRILRQGDVLDGGSVGLYADRGYVVVEQGAVIDVSGTATELDIAENGLPALGITPTVVGSDAGEIQLWAAEGMVVEGTIKGDAGSATNLAGSLLVELNRGRRSLDTFSQNFPVTPLQISFTQGSERNFSDSYAFGDNLRLALTAETLLDSEAIQQAGFDYLTFRTPGNIQFYGDIDLSAGVALKFDAAKIQGQQQAGTSGRVTVSAPYLALGSSRLREVSGNPALGAGNFNVDADWIELYGALMLSGFSQVNINSRNDIRTVGIRLDERDYVGELVTAADLHLTSKQLYPSTLTQFKLAVENNEDGRLTLSGLPNDLAAPLSSGGQLTLQAPQIEQGGTLLAPLGQLYFETEKLTFAAGSVTSVSGDGLLVPYGIVQIGRDWLYPLDSFQNLIIDAPPEKRIEMNADEIVIADGARLDLSGGGDVFAYEFEPGLGGSFDLMDAESEAYQNSFAILPGLGTTFAPFDHFQTLDAHLVNSDTVNAYRPGETVYLDGGGDLPAGEYVKLPAHYALLPGAYLVTPISDNVDQSSLQYTLDGRLVMSGYNAVAGVGKKDARSSGFLVENRQQIDQKATYSTYTSEQFFTDQAQANETQTPLLTRDSGLLSIRAANDLILDGIFAVNALEGGLGLRMELVSNNLVIVDEFSDQSIPGVLEVSADDLSQMNIASLLLGAQRIATDTDGETTLNVNSQHIVFERDATLDVADLIVAANNSIVVKEDATIAASGLAQTGEQQFNITGDGAVLRVSGSAQAEVNRVQSSGLTGELLIEQGATLQARTSMLLDSSRATQLAGTIVMSGGSLNLAANTINIGDVDGLAGNALNLSNASFEQLSVDELILTSRDAIHFYGSTGRFDDGSGLLQQLSDSDLSPVTVERLVLNAAGLRGHAVGTDPASINLKTSVLEFKNTAGVSASSALPATGTGTLNIEAEQLIAGEGIFLVDGFDQVNWAVSGQFVADGTGTLKSDADLTLTAGVISAGSQANYLIDASGYHAAFMRSDVAAVADTQALGGRFSVDADNISLNTQVDLAGGTLELNANNNILLGAGASINLAGRHLSFDDQSEVAASGGNLYAQTETGDIVFAAGSSVNLDGASETNGGQLRLSTASVGGNVDLQGELSVKGGRVALDVSGYDEISQQDALFAAIAASGADQELSYRSRDRDIQVSSGTSLSAQQVTLTSDSGAVIVAGTINADADTDSRIELHAAERVVLQSGAELSARTRALNGAENAAGGSVLLATYAADNTGIAIESGATVAVGNGDGEQGEVVLRAPRIDTDNDGADDSLNVSSIAGDISGYVGGGFYAEGVKTYQESDGDVGLADITRYRSDADQYMSAANQQAVASLYSGLRLRPGVEIQAPGDLKLSSELDTVDWRYTSFDAGQTAGVGHLTLRAGGNVLLNQNLSDGFKDQVFGFFTQINDKLQTGDSWSFDVVAGADLASADATFTSNDQGDLTIGSNVAVRTGSGDIGLYAGGDINFTDQTSVVINAGRADEVSPYGNFNDSHVEFTFYAEYPQQGGDINIRAGGDINGAVSDQALSEWLFRQGNWSQNATHSGEEVTAWGIGLGYINSNFSRNVARSSTPFFEQNIGSFGGGTVNVSASGSIQDLSVMMPTTGKPVGTRASGTFNDFLTNEVEINGGGYLSVTAGNDIAGGAYLLGQGQASFEAGGSITGGQQYTSGPLLALGDTQVTLQANRDLHVAAVIDPMMLEAGSSQNTNFFSYSADSAIALLSQAGDIYLSADSDTVEDFTQRNDNLSFVDNIYPATLTAAALGGDILLSDNLTLFPSASGDLELLAHDNITTANDVQGSSRLKIGLSDTDPSVLPSALLPRASDGLGDTSTRLSPFNTDNVSLKVLHASVPLHSNDSEPATVITQQGDIGGIDYYLPKFSYISAGGDLTSARIRIQHNNDEDLSVIKAAGNVQFPSELNPNTGALLKPPVTAQPGIEIAGPGQLVVIAGDDIDLGQSRGILSIGAEENPVLGDAASSLTVMAGTSSEPGYLAFIQAMLTFREEHADDPIVAGEFYQDLDAWLAEHDPNELSADRLNTELLPLFFTALKHAGVAESGGNVLGNRMGFTAIEALFPAAAQWSGDIDLFFSRINAAEGGDIRLLAPGGNINVGLSVAVQQDQNTSVQDPLPEGIIARSGAVSAYLDGNFEVNESRVIAMGGGDIVVWSSFGNIDAGRGAKSALSLPPPKVVFNPNTNQFEIEFPAAIDGSGIRTASSLGSPLGDAFLFAPNGVINASEAGIDVNNLFVVAKAVLGSDNINVGGVSVGVPTTAAAAPPVTGLSNAASSVSKAAEQSVQEDSAADGDQENGALAVLSVEIVGFGTEEKQKDKDS